MAGFCIDPASRTQPWYTTYGLVHTVYTDTVSLSIAVMQLSKALYAIVESYVQVRRFVRRGQCCLEGVADTLQV